MRRMQNSPSSGAPVFIDAPGRSSLKCVRVHDPSLACFRYLRCRVAEDISPLPAISPSAPFDSPTPRNGQLRHLKGCPTPCSNSTKKGTARVRALMSRSSTSPAVRLLDPLLRCLHALDALDASRPVDTAPRSAISLGATRSSVGRSPKASKRQKRAPQRTFAATRANGRQDPSVRRRCSHFMKYVTRRMMGMWHDSCGDSPLGE
jgi:hypothetical protein